jgi:SAM-dependent methyltransferase
MPDFARFDQRHYPTVAVVEGYRDWTPTYEDTVQDSMDVALLDRVESVAWAEMRRVVDLGCGTGRTGAWLCAKEASGLHGVDVTPEMLGLARRRKVYDQLLLADVTATGLPDHAYELATCCLVDEHLADLRPLYAEAARLLDARGFFVLVGYHPSFMMKTGMPTHFEHPARGPIAVETHVHLFADHVRAARAAGFVGVELHEALVDDAWVELKPRWAEHRDWPVSFAWVWRPAAAMAAMTGKPPERAPGQE